MSDLQFAHPVGLTRPLLHVIYVGAPVTRCGLLAKDWRRMELVLEPETNICHWCVTRIGEQRTA